MEKEILFFIQFILFYFTHFCTSSVYFNSHRLHKHTNRTGFYLTTPSRRNATYFWASHYGFCQFCQAIKYKKSWHHAYNMPQVGTKIAYLHLDSPFLGNAVGIMPFIEMRLWNTPHYQMILVYGFGYTSNRYAKLTQTYTFAVCFLFHSSP